ncbi:hypothetical protein [Dryocola sp. BD626]|uniref:hypothetical protein n=1 Tax=Dryocola sp. BD626 TaxID=3133273 RepID=UPI003F4FA459
MSEQSNNKLTDERIAELADKEHGRERVGKTLVSPSEITSLAIEVQQLRKTVELQEERSWSAVERTVVNYPRCEALAEILRECRIARDEAQVQLQEYRNASNKPVAEVVAWSHSEKTGRTCDVRLLRFDLKPCLLYAAPQIQPVSEPYKLPTGWIAVPVEPTENMIIEGFESEPDESFSTPGVWEAHQAMSGCQQAAYRAKLCWSAMLAAAPKMDDVNSSVRKLAPKKQ